MQSNAIDMTSLATHCSCTDNKIHDVATQVVVVFLIFNFDCE